MPNFFQKCTAVCLAAALGFMSVGCLDWEEDLPAEEQGNASDTYTLMLYMCASDLESEGGFATEDLNEIMYGYNAGNLNVIVQTGGTEEWQNTVIADDRCQRYQVTEDGLELVDDSLGMQNMADGTTLTDFIRYCSSNYTAADGHITVHRAHDTRSNGNLFLAYRIHIYGNLLRRYGHNLTAGVGYRNRQALLTFGYIF